MEPLNLLETIEEVQTQAHSRYLETWSIITEGAENNGEYSNELLYRVIDNQQQIASDLQMLATLVAELTKIVEKSTGTTATF